MSPTRVTLSVAMALCAASLLASCTQGMNAGETAGDEIVLINRQNSSGTYKYFQETVLDKNDFKANTKDQSGSQAVVDLVGTMPLAIGYSGMGYKTDAVKFLKVSTEKGGEAQRPTVANAQSGAYPITRPLQIYTKGQPEGPIAHYVQWMLSEEGQKIVADKGYVPLPPQPITAADPTEAASFQVTGSDTMVQLAQAWAAAYNKKYPQVKVQVSGGGSGGGITAMMEGTVDIANASRKMKASEMAKAQQKGIEPIEFEVGKDALAVYVHKDNPLDEICIPELAEIYAEGGKISLWQQITGYPQKQ